MVAKWVIILLAAGSALVSSGQALEPRFYSNAPVGLNFVLGGVVYSVGGLSVDPALDLKDANLDIYAPFTAYARSFGLFGKSAKFDMVIPYAFLEGTGVYKGAEVERKTEGFADPTFRVSYNIYGAPALSLEEFKNYEQDLVLGTSLKVTAPFGQYDDDKAVNIGQNRWAFTPELGASKRIGRMLLEAAAGVALFTDNPDFRGRRKEQDPLYSVQAHIVYVFQNNIWISLDATRYVGGQSTVGGVVNKDKIESSRIGATLALPITKRNSIKLYMSSGIDTRTGSDFDTYGLAWQYRWGGGM